MPPERNFRKNNNYLDVQSIEEKDSRLNFKNFNSDLGGSRYIKS